MKDKKQMRYSDEELNLLKSMFADNEDLAYTVRKAMFFGGLNDAEIATLKANFGTKEAMALMSKSFYPQIESTDPLQQVVDLWMTVDLKEKTGDDVKIVLKARQQLIERVEKALQAIAEPSAEPLHAIAFNLTGDTETDQINLVARNVFINHVAMVLNSAVLLAGTKTETVEETVKRIQKDSSK